MGLKVFDNQNTDLEVKQFANLAAIKGTQFGRDVYSSVLKFKDLDKFLSTFPNVQRAINPRKVASLKRYILSGLNSTEGLNMRFFSAITVTCRGTIYYGEAFHQIAIDTEKSKLSINDGQHRFQAINEVLEHLEDKFVNSNDKETTGKMQDYIMQLKDMVVPIVIFDGLTEKEEKQLFHDLNNLAQRPSRSANIRLNQTDLYSRMARELADENRYLDYYGVEEDKMSIQPINPNTILLTTIYECTKELLRPEYKEDRKFLNETNFELYKARVSDIFDDIFFALPPDINVKAKYLTEKSYTLKAICKFITDSKTHPDLMLTDDQIYDVIRSIDWTMNLDAWSEYSATSGVREGNIVFGGGVHGGLKAVYQALLDKAYASK